MPEQLKELEKYWSGRAEGYSAVNQEELAGEQHQKWLHYLQNRKAALLCKFFCMDAESPAWDTALLEAIGYKNITIDTEISSRIYKCCNEFYNPTPMFLIRAEK